MYKITKTYKDYDGNERTEDFYFNLTKAEILETQLSINGGLEKMVQKIINTQDSAAMIKLFKDLVLLAYGEKSEDGRRFIKSKEVKDNFSETEAYSEIFVELATDDKAAAAFMNGIIPQEYRDEMAKAQISPLPIPNN